ncbi:MULTISPECIES: nitroreductase [unclassified Paenibacillus]|uniref:nitroreductase family protein n=1 Tax=unclassified Paenibacillus TaxID=185978 RepID=UPI001AE5A3B2|nr:MULTISPECIES: nitroreductase [unclassified Paenibacillus]MBP1154881.1 nitroreductase [Paenibacillus sp. PvP091]MBP1169735.1 nitroreductase [Paenibacillus sp. PvR098]MBP2440763.1 nitroreductase [Paenibacillus sp. PvP052]
MSITKALRSRRAVRSYEPKEVETEKINALLEAATWAPNDRLREPWHFYVIRGEAKARYEQIARDFLEERFPTKPHLVKESIAVLEATPLVIVATSDVIPGDEASSEDNEYAVACAIHSMWLTAQELGLGLVWRTRGIGLSRDERLYKLIGSPENKKIVGAVFVGYPSADSVETKRTAFQDKTTWL